MEKVSNISKKQYAYEFLRAKILDGTYGPGYRLVIDQIAKDLNLSKIPVREAISQLEADDLIQVKPYSGAIVQLRNNTDYYETMDVLGILEGYATALAARLITKEIINSLKGIGAEIKQAIADLDFEKVGELNREFHGAIFECCGNSYLKDEIRQGWLRLAQFRQSVFTFVPQRARESADEHDYIIQLIENKASIREIEEYVRQHRLNTVKAILDRKNKVEG